MDIAKMWDKMWVFAQTYGLQIAGAIAILVIGRIVASIVRKSVRRLMEHSKTEPTLVSFVSSFAYYGIMVAVVIATMSKFGIQTTSMVAILGALGFAVGFALKETLGNVAAGIMVMVFKPYHIGHFIDAGGVKGSVKEITLFNTILATGDNVRVIVPNGQIYAKTITNFTANPTRRVDLVIGIGYDSSVKQARDIMTKLMADDDRILKDPAPVIGLNELGDSSVNFVVRPWVKREDYWAVRWELQEKIKEEFDKAAIEIPFPQRVVHMANAAAESASASS